VREVASQEELAALLRERGYAVTQATVSRDIADLGLVKAPRGDRHLYVTPGALAAGALGDGRAWSGLASGTAAGAAEAARTIPDQDEPRLRHILADHPVTVGRSGLTLVLVSRPGAAPAIAQAIDESNLRDQVGTLAGDNTVLVLFADEPALERWRARFEVIAAQAAGDTGADLTTTYP
jgi:transcriptional regulator of arginine metabolism